MPRSLGSSVLFTVAMLVLHSGCASEDASAPSGRGSLTVATTTTGSPTDPDGYQLILDDSLAGVIPPTGQVVFPAVPAGPHTLRLQGIALNCTSDWYAPRPVVVRPADSTTVAYALRCTAPSPRPIVFSSTRDNIGRDIYRSDVSGSNIERLTTHTSIGDDQPSLSPGGTRIAFVRFIGTLGAGSSAAQLWVMDADGSNATHLGTDSIEWVQSPSWSPDGTHLVFIRDGRIVMMTADGRSEENLTTGSTQAITHAWEPRWSPDGSAISYSTDIGHVLGIRIVDLRTRQSHDIVLPGDSLHMGSPTWAPGGDRMLFCRARPGTSTCDISTISLDGTGLTVLSAPVAGVVAFTYAPDGRQIIVNAYDSGSFFDLFTLSAAGGSLTDVSNTPTIHELFPSWGP